MWGTAGRGTSVWESMARLGVLIGLAVASLLATPLSGCGGAGNPGGPTGGDEGPAVAGGVTSYDGGAPAAALERAVASERPAGTLVFVFRSSRLGAIDVASGRRTVRRVPALAACGPELYVTGGHVIFAGVREGQTVVYSAPVSLDRAPRRLGAAHAFVPSATEGRVWLAGVDCSRRVMVGVREITVDGQTTLASRRRVPGSWLAGAVEGGLLIQRDRTPSVWNPLTAMWNPRTPATARRLRLETVGDTRGSLLIGCRRSRCRELLIVDAGTAREVPVRPPRRYRLELGEFSPDGSLVAAPAVSRRRWSVALVDTRDGRTTIVPGSRTGAAYPELSWSASTGWLFFRAGGDRIMAYRPGARRALTLPVRLPRRALAFMAG